MTCGQDTRFYGACKVTPWYWAIIGEWREISPFSNSAVEIGSFMELSILGEWRGRSVGQAGAIGVVNPCPHAEFATGVSTSRFCVGANCSEPAVELNR